METLSPLAFDRAALSAWYQANRARSAALFRIIDPDVYFQAPIPLRHPFVFYDGHFPAFSFITLIRNALGEPSIDRRLEDLFNRGIDPDHSRAPAAISARTGQPEPRSRPSPARAMRASWRPMPVPASTIRRTRNSSARKPLSPILEHEEMHHETLSLHRASSPGRPQTARSQPSIAICPRPQRDPIAIPAGQRDARRSRRRGPASPGTTSCLSTPSPWRRSACDAFDVTNGEYLAFVRAGGPVPPFWVERDGEWGLRAFAGTIALPHSWPVYCTNAQAAAFARWSGARLLTEAEFHRAPTVRPRATSGISPGAATGPTRHAAISISNVSTPNRSVRTRAG